MQTIKELFEEAVRYEEALLAHAIFHLIQTGEVSADQPISDLDFEKADWEKMKELVNENYLKFRSIKVYSLKQDAKTFAFIFAKNEEEAIQFHKKKFRRNPLNCFEFSKDYRIQKGEGFFDFRELIREHDQFPALAGLYVKDVS